ncbi:MAG: carboxypeptidase regulatory-like domain-containing protein, partial [bacterium]|nr:carboxypeptidase regulatory-like domain-containing protein [bacterium]
RETWAPRSEQTDAKGEYSLVGLPSGNQPIQVRALGYALWNGSMDLQVGVQSTLDITLSKGCTLSGTVSDPDGKPIVKAKVLAFFEPLPEGYLQSGQIEYDGVFACPATYTDEAGHYNLPHVSDGQVYLYAQRPPVDPMDYTEIRLYAKAQMDLTEKTAATWNAVVGKGLSIEGHIYYADDVPITGVHVLLEGSPGSETRVRRSTDGSFLFTQLEDKLYTVRVAMWDLEQGQKQPELRDVRPGSAPLVIVADFNSPKEIVPANGQLRLIDAGHRIQGEPSIRLRSKGHNGRASGRLENGVWNFKIEKPGKYQAVAYSDARIIAVGEEFTIESGEVRTLPDLVTIAGGTLILEIQKPKTPFPTGLRGWIRIGPSRSSPHEAFELDFASELRIENLEPGEGILQILGDNVQEAEIPIAIMPGVETRLVVPLVSAVPVPFHIEWPASEASGPLTTRFLDRTSGSIIREFNYEDISLIRSPVDWSIPMPLGSFRLEVIKAGEPYYSEDFEVTSLEPGRAPKLGLTK